MWQELAAAAAAVLLGTAAFWNGFLAAGILYLANLGLALHVVYLSLAAWGIHRVDRRTGREHAERSWLLLAASAFAAAAVVAPVVLGEAGNVTAGRDNLVFGGAAFFFALWAALDAARETEGGEDAEAGEARSPAPAP